jgi:hypothetical protein
MSETSTLHCAVCGGPARAPFHAPRPPEIAPDLDMRPGEPVRSTLSDWLQACGRCHAAGWDLSALPPAAKSVVESAAYRALSTEAAEDTLLFRRWAMICLAAGDKEEAAEATLQAAWAADDGAGMVEAAKLRRDVAALWGDAPDLDLATGLRLLDVLRRAGEFAAVEARGAQMAAGALDAFAAAAVAFQRASAAERDVGSHLLTSAAPDHVLPDDLPKPKFWDRLFER